MYQLIKAGERTYYVECPSRVGIYLLNEKEVCLIDSGNDKDFGGKILRILEENNWTLKTIISTHLHVDHIGGNDYLQKNTGCEILAPKEEMTFIEHPKLKPAFIFGGFPLKELTGSSVVAKPSICKVLTEENLPDGLSMITLEGHSLDMIAIKTSDEVWFLADSLFSLETMNKYHICFIYDVKSYLESLEKLKKIEGKLFIPSHAIPSDNIEDLINENQRKTLEILENVKDILASPKTLEEVVREIFNSYSLKISLEQHFLITFTIRSYLAYMYHSGIIDIEFINNMLYWRKK